MGYRGAKLAALADERLAKRAVREIARNVGAAMTDATRRHAAVRTGAHRESIAASPVKPIPGGYRSGAETDHPLAAVFEYGAQPHAIEPKNTQAITPDGRPAARVEHPGRAGDHAFLKGAAEADARLERIAQPALERARARWEAEARGRRQ